MKKTILGRYEVTDKNKVFIDISVNTAEELYNHFEQNTPDTPKELNQEFADYIIDGVRETEENKFIIRITLLNMPDEKTMIRVRGSIQTYFHHRKDLENSSIEKMLSRSFKLFGFGLAFLFIAIVFNRFFSLSEWTLTRIFYEGLTITGWLLLWAAIVTLIIKWPPQRENIKLYEKIIKAQVTFHH